MTASLAPDANVQVTIAFPFAAAGQRTITYDSATDPLLLRAAEMRLPFSFAGLPTTVNQDVIITITADGASNFTKYRRFMRAPPPASPSVLAVQVDHTTKSLLVDGRIWSGQGWYIAHEDMPMNGKSSSPNHHISPNPHLICRRLRQRDRHAGPRCSAVAEHGSAVRHVFVVS